MMLRHSVLMGNTLTQIQYSTVLYYTLALLNLQPECVTVHEEQNECSVTPNSHATSSNEMALNMKL